MSSTSPDSEMGFDPEDSEIYYIAEVETAYQYRKLQAMTTKLIYMLTTLWPTKSGQSKTRRRWMLTKNLNEL